MGSPVNSPSLTHSFVPGRQDLTDTMAVKAFGLLVEKPSDSPENEKYMTSLRTFHKGGQTQAYTQSHGDSASTYSTTFTFNEYETRVDDIAQSQANRSQILQAYLEAKAQANPTREEQLEHSTALTQSSEQFRAEELSSSNSSNASHQTLRSLTATPPPASTENSEVIEEFEMISDKEIQKTDAADEEFEVFPEDATSVSEFEELPTDTTDPQHAERIVHESQQPKSLTGRVREMLSGSKRNSLPEPTVSPSLVKKIAAQIKLRMTPNSPTTKPKKSVATNNLPNIEFLQSPKRISHHQQRHVQAKFTAAYDAQRAAVNFFNTANKSTFSVAKQMISNEETIDYFREKIKQEHSKGISAGHENIPEITDEYFINYVSSHYSGSDIDFAALRKMLEVHHSMSVMDSDHEVRDCDQYNLFTLKDVMKHLYEQK